MSWYVDKDPNAFHKDVANEIGSLTSVTPADSDVLLIEDASAGFAKRKVTVASLGGGGSGGGVLWSPILDDKPGSADTPDCDFDQELGNYTPVSGSETTVDPLASASTAGARYDLDTRPGYLLMQCGQSQRVQFRCDYTLPDNRSIIAAMSGPLNAEEGDNAQVGITVNDNDTDAQAGNYLFMGLEQDSTAWDIQSVSQASSTGKEMNGIEPFSKRIYFRIMRSGLLYTAWFSFDGMTWTYVFSYTAPGALTNIWFKADGSSSGTYANIFAIDWIREGSNDLDPW